MTSNDANDVTERGRRGARLKGAKGGGSTTAGRHRVTSRVQRRARARDTRIHGDASPPTDTAQPEKAARLAARSHARLVEPAKSLPANRSSCLATRRARGQGRKLNGANEQTCYFATKSKDPARITIYTRRR